MTRPDQWQSNANGSLACRMLEPERPHNAHFCRIHQKESALVDSVVRYLAAGASCGETLVVITNPARQKRIFDWLEAKGTQVSLLRRQGRVFTYASSDLMEAVSLNGVPSWELFSEVVPGLVDESSANRSRRFRLYGDAVSEYWQTGHHEAALLLERMWNRFRAQEFDRFSVFCGYLIDALNSRTYSEHLFALAAEHKVTLPPSEDTALRCAVDVACRDVLGGSMTSVTAGRSMPGSESGLPFVFRFIMWIREAHSEKLEQVLAKARMAYRKLG